jgi:hypothetical protein
MATIAEKKDTKTFPRIARFFQVTESASDFPALKASKKDEISI